MGAPMIDRFKIPISNEMLAYIARLDEFKGAWKLFGNLTPDRLKSLKRVATIESIGSSTRIEGSKLSDSEVEKLLTNIEERSLISQDEQEVAGYACVCEEFFFNYESIPFSENVIKQLHGSLLNFSDKDQRHRGEYKTISNHIEAFDENGKSLGIIFETTSPFETPYKMQELIYWVKEELDTKNLHPLLVIGLFVVMFLAIHPFQDGNGRLSRILTTFLLLKFGYVYVPYSSLESIIEKNKEAYYLALRKTQTSLKNDNPDFTSWLLFFLRILDKQRIHLEQKISKEKATMLYVSESVSQILIILHEHGRVGINVIVKITGINRNTVKKHLKTLVDNGTILKHGKGRATWYTLP